MTAPPRPIHYTGPSAEIWADPDVGVGMETIPAISIAQPWASWIALGWKTIETRSHSNFACLVGQRIAIHASKAWDRESMDVADVFMSAEQIRMHGRLTAAGFYPEGEIVAVVTMLRLQPCTRVELATAALCWYEGGVGYVLGDVSAVPRGIQVSGAQGVFYVSLPSLWVRQLPLPLFAPPRETAETPA